MSAGALWMGSAALAVPFGDGGAALQGVLDDITTGPTAGSSRVNVTTDFLSDSTDSYWKIGGSGGSLSTLVIELAGFAENNRFGIYDAADPSKKVEIFAGAAAAGDQAVISILANGMVRLNFSNTGIVFGGNRFGYYLDSSFYAPDGGVWYSDTSLNGDGLDHMAAYQGVGDTISIPPYAAGPWASNEYILAFEDLAASVSDRDYTDFVVLVESVSPVPDGGATLALLGAGFLGLLALRRRMA